MSKMWLNALCLQFESNCWWNRKMSSASAEVCMCVYATVCVCVCGCAGRCSMYMRYMGCSCCVVAIIIMGVASALISRMMRTLYFGFIPTEWHQRRRLTHPLISPAPVPRRPPDSSDRQCSSPDHQSDCPCHQCV